MNNTASRIVVNGVLFIREQESTDWRWRLSNHFLGRPSNSDTNMRIGDNPPKRIDFGAEQWHEAKKALI